MTFIMELCHWRASRQMVTRRGTISHSSDKLISQMTCFRVPPKALCPGFYLSVSLLALHVGPYGYGRPKQGPWLVSSIFKQFAGLGRCLPARWHLWYQRSAQDLGCWCLFTLAFCLGLFLCLFSKESGCWRCFLMHSHCQLGAESNQIEQLCCRCLSHCLTALFSLSVFSTELHFPTLFPLRHPAELPL